MGDLQFATLCVLSHNSTSMMHATSCICGLFHKTFVEKVRRTWSREVGVADAQLLRKRLICGVVVIGSTAQETEVHAPVVLANLSKPMCTLDHWRQAEPGFSASRSMCKGLALPCSAAAPES